MSAISFDPYSIPQPAPEPAKKKPRGAPFRKGHDPRRAHSGVLTGMSDGTTCPACNVGTVQTRFGSRGPFLGCTNYPTCDATGNVHAVAAAQPAPIAATLPAPVAGSLDAMVAAIAASVATGAVNAEQVNALIDSRVGDLSTALASVHDFIMAAKAELAAEIAKLATLGPQSMTITVNGAPAVTIAGATHKLLPRVLKLAAAGFRNILLVGPAGAGKTFLGEQVAEAMCRNFATLSCAPGLPESALIGRMIPNLTTGGETYRATPLVGLIRNGGVFLLDEVDNADASTLLILNSMMANGHITLPSGERVQVSPDFLLIASANTYGHGQNRMYVGRSQLDAAFLNRFAGATLDMDYDRDLERTLCPETHLRDAIHSMRDKMQALGTVRRILSTRDLLALRKLVLAVGDSLPDALLALTVGWSVEDRRALGIVA